MIREEIDEKMINNALQTRKHFKSWIVFIDNKLIDTVNYVEDLNEEQVRRALIVDGYPREIHVEEE